VGELAEGRHAVGLGPDADATGAADVVVAEIDVALAVERDADLRAGELDPQRVPLAARDRRIDVLEGLADAARGVVERDVVLERVGASDVVVVAVLPAPDDATGLVFLAGKGLELRLDPAVGQRCIGSDAPRKGR
jgi:hypothetical protein